MPVVDRVFTHNPPLNSVLFCGIVVRNHFNELRQFLNNI